MMMIRSVDVELDFALDDEERLLGVRMHVERCRLPLRYPNVDN